MTPIQSASHDVTRDDLDLLVRGTVKACFRIGYMTHNHIISYHINGAIACLARSLSRYCHGLICERPTEKRCLHLLMSILA